MGICTVKLKHFSDCNSKNVVYLILCECKKIYISVSRRRVKVHFLELFSHIKNKVEDIQLVSHFLKGTHAVENLQVFVLSMLHVSIIQL